jgi:mechanosensitive ion channel-like protein
MTDLSQATIGALIALWERILVFLPSLILAILVFIVGWFIAIGIGALIAQILTKLKFNNISEKGGWKNALDKAEITVNPSEFIGGIVKWILVITFLTWSVEILGSDQFAKFLGSILLYLPNVIVAALIFVVTVVLVDIVEKIVKAAVEKSKVGYSQMASSIVKWAIWIFAILAILEQLGIARAFMQIIFSGLVVMLAISFGLAFGLGGKETASDILSNLRGKLKK